MSDSTSPSLPPPTQNQPTALTPADRIAELNSIDHSVSALLASAAEAVGILSNSTDAVHPPTFNPTRDLESAQEHFRSAARNYFSTLSSIEVRLKRQVYALEEAGLIEEGDERDARRARTFAADGEEQVRQGGGALDPSWLNAMVDGRNAYEVERRMADQAKELLDQVDRDKAENGERQGS